MTNPIECLAACMSHENNITLEEAQSLVNWLENEGVLDYDILKETYEEPRPTVESVLRAVND